MQVMFTCQCGQALRTEVGQAPVCVQCPSCGKMITVWPPAGAAGPWGPRAGGAGGAGADGPGPAGGKAVAALVLGLCGLVPAIGVLAVLPAIVLGLIVLRRRLPGRGFGIAGLSVAVGSLLTIQVGTVLYAFMVYTMITQTMAMMPMPGRPRTLPTTTLNRFGELVTARLDTEEIAAALSFGFGDYEDANAASAALAKARLLYDSREMPGTRFECLRQFQLHLARRAGGNFADPADAEKYKRTHNELVQFVLDKYDQADLLEGGGDWLAAEKVYESITVEVPAVSDSVRLAVLKCQMMASDESGAARVWRETSTAVPATWPAEP